MTEDLDSQEAGNPGSFLINDSFQTRNQFNGVELGVLWQGRRGYWSLDAYMRTGIGTTLQTVDIRGTTEITQGTVTTPYTGGLLAQRTNIGTYKRNQLGVVPELGATIGYQLTPKWRLTTGYTFIYWSNVVRPGDQIDLDVNPALFAPEAVPFTGANRPRFQFRETDYWVQGINFGAEYRW